MALTPKYAERIAERVAVLETRFDALKETVEIGFEKLGEKIDAASLNGQTPRVKDMAAKLGDPEDVAILVGVVETRRRWAWLLSPLTAPNNNVLGTILWIGTAGALAAANSWVHSVVPWFP